MENRKREFDFTAAGQESVYSPEQSQRIKIVHVSLFKYAFKFSFLTYILFYINKFIK